MIHAYASIWRCLKSAHKGGNGNNCQAVYREYMKGEEGVLGGASPPEANGMLKKSNKMEASPFQRRGGGCCGLVVNTSDSGSRVAVLCP